MDVAQFATYVGVITGVAAILGVTIRAVGKSAATTYRVVKRTDTFLGDWFGRPDSGQQSFPDRMGALESRVDMIGSRVDTIEAQLRPNGGGSMRDAVDNIVRATGASGQ